MPERAGPNSQRAAPRALARAAAAWTSDAGGFIGVGRAAASASAFGIATRAGEKAARARNSVPAAAPNRPPATGERSRSQALRRVNWPAALAARSEAWSAH